MRIRPAAGVGEPLTCSNSYNSRFEYTFPFIHLFLRFLFLSSLSLFFPLSLSISISRFLFFRFHFLFSAVRVFPFSVFPRFLLDTRHSLCPFPLSLSLFSPSPPPCPLLRSSYSSISHGISLLCIISIAAGRPEVHIPYRMLVVGSSYTYWTYTCLHVGALM